MMIGWGGPPAHVLVVCLWVVRGIEVNNPLQRMACVIVCCLWLRSVVVVVCCAPWGGEFFSLPAEHHVIVLLRRCCMVCKVPVQV